MTPLICFANNTDSPINIANKTVLLQATAVTVMWSILRMIDGYASAFRPLTGKRVIKVVDYDFISPVAGGSNVGIYRYS